MTSIHLSIMPSPIYQFLNNIIMLRGESMSYEKELERLKAKLNESYEILSLLKEQNTCTQTDQMKFGQKEIFIEGAVNKLSEEQNLNVENTDLVENLQQELKDLKTIFLAMQQDLSDIKQLLIQQNENKSNESSNSQPKTNTHQPSRQRTPSYNQLQQFAKSVKRSQPTKKKKNSK
ncbi:hypothetical protein ACTWQB_06055 [Piscibacillus sp. B03]|uniref:hypothetical protein n=1 Tax=Piscibacillus sp. B03 TaxID=3457430 RepID=UPI003FCDF904